MTASSAPHVTVLIDTYNYAHFIGRAIESALVQVYDGPPLDILVVDDGSSDDTADVVRRFGPRVRYLCQDNRGQAAALALGFSAARGEVVCLLDADDFFYPGKVQAVADVFRDRPEVGLVYNEFALVDAAGASLGKAYPEPTWTGVRLPLATIPPQLRTLILLGHPWTCITSAMSVRRSVVEELALPAAVFPHSPDLFLGLVLPFLTEVGIVETLATAYVFHGKNVGLFRSSAANRALFQEQMRCIRRVLQERFGERVMHYSGRGLYGPAEGGTREPDLSAFAADWRMLAAARVHPDIKRRCRLKLVASLVLPDAFYNPLRTLKASRRNRRNRNMLRPSAPRTRLEQEAGR